MAECDDGSRVVARPKTKPAGARRIAAERPNAIVVRAPRARRVVREPEYAALGVIASRAPRAALLRALRELRPQFEVRLRRLEGVRGGAHYLVEARLLAAERERPHSIDLWLRIKSALLAAFPAGSPGAVTPLER